MTDATSEIDGDDGDDGDVAVERGADYDVPAAGVPADQGESWAACARRLRGGRRRLHPLVAVTEVVADD